MQISRVLETTPSALKETVLHNTRDLDASRYRAPFHRDDTTFELRSDVAMLFWAVSFDSGIFR